MSESEITPLDLFRNDKRMYKSQLLKMKYFVECKIKHEIEIATRHIKEKHQKYLDNFDYEIDRISSELFLATHLKHTETKQEILEALVSPWESLALDQHQNACDQQDS